MTIGHKRSKVKYYSGQPAAQRPVLSGPRANSRTVGLPEVIRKVVLLEFYNPAPTCPAVSILEAAREQPFRHASHRAPQRGYSYKKLGQYLLMDYMQRKTRHIH
jgi:hypothetical protein